MFEEGRPWYYLTGTELHAIVFGFLNVLKPGATESPIEEECRKAEPHYYKFGEVIGMATLAAIGIVIAHFGVVVW